MKLYYHPASPYVRKARAVALESGIALELVDASWMDHDDHIHTANPLGRIPALLRDDGQLMVDSPVICEYLDSLKPSGLFPPNGEPRWLALTLQAFGDGLCDSAVPWRQELMRPEGKRSDEWMQRRQRQIETTLAHLEGRLSDLEDWTIGTLAIACAWGYLHFRFGEHDWDRKFPGLAAWFAAQSARPSLAETLPE